MNVFPFAKTPPLSRTAKNTAQLRHACARALSLNALPLTALSSIALLLFTAAPTFAANETGTPATRAEVSEKKTDLKELRGQIETLRKQMNAAEGQRADAADQVKDVERDISTTQRELYKLSGEQARLQATLKDLGKQEQTLTDNLDALHAQLADLVTRRYQQGHPDALQMLLNGENPSQTARDLYYLSIIGHARKQLLAETTVLLQRKRALAEDARERSDELSTVEARQKEQRNRLLTQREQRKDVLDKISSKIAEQRKEIGSLQRDERQLSQLIVRLDRIIAANAAEEARAARRAARAAALEREKEREKEKERRPTPSRESGKSADDEAPRTAPKRPTELVNEQTPEAAPGSNFAALKGRLHLPVRGTLTNRYGSARQEGSTWKGLFIRATQGSEIKAIAGGRVVFADWMRGFGNLLIVDHGDNYLSIYGYSDAVLKDVGDRVRGGDSIATAGSSGGNTESGLYFELRHRGQPIDPLQWVSLK